MSSGSSESSSLFSLNTTKLTSQFELDSDNLKSQQDTRNEANNLIGVIAEKSDSDDCKSNERLHSNLTLKDKRVKRTSYRDFICYFDILTLAKHLFNYIILFFYLWKNANSNLKSDKEFSSPESRKSSSSINNVLISLIILLLCCLLYIYVFLIFVKINSIENELLYITRSLLK